MSAEIDMNIGNGTGPSSPAAQVDRSGPTPPPPSRSQTKDPTIGLRFWIELGNVGVATFRECSPIVIETETFEYKEGGLNTYTHKLPVRTKYTNITLKHGLDHANTLYEWYVQVANGQITRRNISIVIYDSLQNVKHKWDFQNAYPCKWTGPELKAESGAIAVETLEIAHEGLLPTSQSPYRS